MKEEWLMPGAVVPVDAETTATLIGEIKRLIGVVGGMALNQRYPWVGLTDEEVGLNHLEPVAWANSFDLQNFDMKVRTCPDLHHTVPLYTAPPKRDLTCVCGAVWEGEMMVHPPRKREWISLTDEEIDYQAKKDDHAVYFALGALWAEAKLKEKNNA